MQFITAFLPSFLLILCRVTSFFVVVPLFSAKNVPMQYKVGLSAFLSFIAASLFANSNIAFDAFFMLEMVKEVLIGLVLGFIIYLFFTVFQIAGFYIDMQLGFSIANTIDPMTGVSTPLFGNFKYMIALLLLLTFNGHHYMISAILDSYKTLPLASEFYKQVASGDLSTYLVKAFVQTFSIAFKMAAPIIVVLFLSDVVLGILTKVAPQFNVFVIGMPLKVLVGLVFLLIVFPIYITIYREHIILAYQYLQDFLDSKTGL